MSQLQCLGNEHRKAKGDQESKQKRDTGVVGSSKGDDACAFCDDGGDLLCCDGGCLRSFHPTKQHGARSKCTTLGLTEEQWRIMKPLKEQEENLNKFICKHCKYKKHQCFACGLLGSSDLSSGSEVFQCRDQNCGHFYHPKCVAELLHPDRPDRALHVKQKVAGGLNFLCPVHRCSVCRGAENKADKKLQFAVCRRCPTVYHRKCLPSDISFKGNEDTARRAWDGILTDQILIYCMKHRIQPRLGTPKRDHIVFPDAKDLCVAKSPKGVPKDHGVLDEDEPVKSKPSQPPQPAETDHDLRFCSGPFDSFAPKALFLRPQPGSCGWLDD